MGTLARTRLALQIPHGLWGYLDLYLKETGITTLLFAGVNAASVFLGLLLMHTIVDALVLLCHCYYFTEADWRTFF